MRAESPPLGTLESFESKFGLASESWALEQWREMALTLAARDMPSVPKKRGRPRGGKDPGNIAALSHEADQERKSSPGISIKESVRRVMLRSAALNAMAANRVDAKIESAIKQVRTYRADLKQRK